MIEKDEELIKKCYDKMDDVYLYIIYSGNH